METLSTPATKVFTKLVTELKLGEGKKLNRSPAFMPVDIDFLNQYNDNLETYAVAHRFVMNGDLVPDPDVEFLVYRAGGVVQRVWPLAIDHPPPFVYRRHVSLDINGQPYCINEKGQADLAAFCSLWMLNIQEQQSL